MDKKAEKKTGKVDGKTGIEEFKKLVLESEGSHLRLIGPAKHKIDMLKDTIFAYEWELTLGGKYFIKSGLLSDDLLSLYNDFESDLRGQLTAEITDDIKCYKCETELDSEKHEVYVSDIKFSNDDDAFEIAPEHLFCGKCKPDLVFEVPESQESNVHIAKYKYPHPKNTFCSIMEIGNYKKSGNFPEFLIAASGTGPHPKYTTVTRWIRPEPYPTFSFGMDLESRNLDSVFQLIAKGVNPL